jgi:glutaredoxin
MKQLAIFTLNTCVLCGELKRRLTEESIDFHDIEITKNRELWDQVLAQTGHDILPTVFIQTDAEGNGQVYTPGRDFQDLDEIIEIIKNNI